MFTNNIQIFSAILGTDKSGNINIVVFVYLDVCFSNHQLAHHNWIPWASVTRIDWSRFIAATVQSIYNWSNTARLINTCNEALAILLVEDINTTQPIRTFHSIISIVATWCEIDLICSLTINAIVLYVLICVNICASLKLLTYFTSHINILNSYTTQSLEYVHTCM